MFMKSAFLRVISCVVASVLLLAAGFSANDAYDVSEPENCLLHFSVVSDTHIEGNNFARYQVFARAMQDVRKNKSGNDAIVFLGDSTMNGQQIESMLFYGTLGLVLKNENIINVMGNHDIGNGEGDFKTLQKRWYGYNSAFTGRTLEHPYFYDVICGCYFIVLGMESQEVHEMLMTEEQFAWLETVLESASGSGKPVFVFSHYPSDYVIDESGEETDRLTRLFADYNREHDLFSFVGHTHMPMYLFWSFHTSDGFPETYLPRLTQLSGSNDNEPYDDTGVGLVVEVYENKVVLRGRDFYRGEWKYDTVDDTMCEVTYELKHPFQPA